VSFSTCERGLYIQHGWSKHLYEGSHLKDASEAMLERVKARLKQAEDKLKKPPMYQVRSHLVADFKELWNAHEMGKPEKAIYEAEDAYLAKLKERTGIDVRAIMVVKPKRIPVPQPEIDEERLDSMKE